MKLTVFSSCECCFLANVYCGCLAFCPLCFYHPEGKGVGHGGEAGVWRGVSAEGEGSAVAPLPLRNAGRCIGRTGLGSCIPRFKFDFLFVDMILIFLAHIFSFVK